MHVLLMVICSARVAPAQDLVIMFTLAWVIVQMVKTELTGRILFNVLFDVLYEFL